MAFLKYTKREIKNLSAFLIASTGEQPLSFRSPASRSGDQNEFHSMLELNSGLVNRFAMCSFDSSVRA
ncbi:hypothetical protein DDZ15_06555 [Rhodohalobacter mucosus]|uniref:Uncharacterized protein n=1 Tax=Rhodohalobacter mucosus TaxID=2079485 RepID=A0A316TUC4_9BACT|nr:hypothetical protein DDZ15_06555 [Rhodohalobacter mucosus]